MRTKGKVYAKDLPCIIKGCTNKNTGKKQRCSTHYKAWKRENIQGFAEKEKIQTKAAYDRDPEKRRAIARKSKEKTTKQIQPLALHDFQDRNLSTVKLTVSEIAQMSEVPGGAWRTLLNNMIEDEMIHSWSYEPESAIVTLQIYKNQELAFVVGFNQSPEGVIPAGTIVADTMGSKDS